MYVTLILLTVNVNTIVQLKMRFMRIQLFDKNQPRIQENNARLCCEENLLGSLKAPNI